jgi:hypothetical protein
MVLKRPENPPVTNSELQKIQLLIADENSIQSMNLFFYGFYATNNVHRMVVNIPREWFANMISLKLKIA